MCRRICQLRECGHAEEAEQLRRTQLADALATVRAREGDDEATIDEKLAAIFATETERVANAAVLAELLAPLLAQSRTAATPDAPLGLSPMNHAPVADGRSAASAPRADPGDIASFIDEMIAHERATPRGSPERRAS